MEVFTDMAIAHSAASVVLVHNHPSGDCEPSEEDIEASKRIKDAGKLMDIKVLDHIIIGKDSWHSV